MLRLASERIPRDLNGDNRQVGFAIKNLAEDLLLETKIFRGADVESLCFDR